MTTTQRHSVAIIVGLMLVGTLGLRALLAWIGDFGPADLDAFERVSGIDLPDRYGHLPFFLTWSRGDGQVYMTIAADPFLTGPSRSLSSPVYRFGRAGYAWAARILVLGRTGLLPVGLVAVNLIALATYTAAVVRARLKHPRALWLLANPALLLGVATDTAEPLALALLVLAIESRSRLSAVAAGALGLVRESYATILGISRRPMLVIAMAAAASIAIRSVAALALGDSPLAGSVNLTWPVIGYLDGLRSLTWPDAALSLLLLAAMVATFVRGFLVRGAWVRMSWWATGLAGLCLSAVVTNNVVNILRALGAVPLLWVLHQPELSDGSVEAS